MAIQVTTGETQVIAVTVNTPTIVKTITVGTPTGVLRPPGSSLLGLSDVNVDSNLEDGQALVYILSDARWRNRSITSLIDSDITVLQAQITSNDSDVLALQLNDSDLDSNVVDLLSRMVTVEGSIQSLQNFDSDQLVINATASSARSLLSSRIDSNSTDITTLQDSVASLSAADTALSSRIDSNALDIATEVNARISGDSALQSQIDSSDTYFRNRDSDIISVTALQASLIGNLQNADSNILSQIDSNALDIANEVNARISGDSSLQSQIDSNETLSKAIDAALLSQIISNDSDILVLQNAPTGTDSATVIAILQPFVDSNALDIATEVAARILADSNLQAQIDSNAVDIATLNASTVTLQTNIDSNALDIATEVNARISADSNLQSQIDSNETLSKATDASLLAQIVSNDSDILVLQNAPAAFNYQPNIDSNALDIATEVNARISAISTLQGEVDSNETLSKATDASLLAQIDSNETLSKATDASLLAQIDSNALDIATEVNARISAVSTLQGEVDSNETLSKATDATLQGAIDSNALDIATLNASTVTLQTNIDSNALDIATEVNARISAVSGIQSQVDSNALDIATEVNARISAISTLQGEVDSNETLSKVTDASLLAQIDSNALDIATEVNARISAISGVQSQVDSNETLSKVTDASLLAQIVSNDSDILALQNQPTGTDSATVISIVDARIDSTNFVDLTSTEIITGIKTFNNIFEINAPADTNSASFHIDSAGFMGLGTNNPQAILDIDVSDPSIRIDDNTGNAGTNTADIRIEFKANGSNAYQFGFINTTTGQFSFRNYLDGDTRFRAAAANNRFRFEDSGGNNTFGVFTRAGLNIGGGLVTPDIGLAVNTADAVQLPSGTTGQEPTATAGRIRWDTTVGKLTVSDGTSFNAISQAFYIGNNGPIGDSATGYGDIFRVNTNTLTRSIQIDSNLNASGTGPISIDSGVTLTINGTLVII